LPTVLDVWICLTVGLSVFFDLAFKKIPNWLILFGLTGGFLLNGAHGASQLYSSIIGFVLGVAILLIPFAVGWVGAGDVKYLGVIGCLLGFKWLPRVLFYSAVVSGVLALTLVIYRQRAPRILDFAKSTWLDFKLAAMSFGQVVPQPVAQRASTDFSGTVPWGVGIGAGVLLAYYFDPYGQWAGF
jgi:prepilin peptidase CpaA